MNRDFGPVVQEEVRRLPEKYRAVVVLCYWQSLSHEQAAAQLGCPLGTVRSRLARARKLLHRRLTRRGLAPLAAIVAAALSEASAQASTLAAVPPLLVKETIRAAAAAASGQALSSVVAGTTASLVQRTLWSMAMIKIKTAAVGLALVGLLGFGVAFVAFNGRAGQAQVAAAGQPQQADAPKDPPGTELLYAMPRELASIAKLVPNGSVVKKGEVVCELDTPELAESLTGQKIASIRARNAYRQNTIAREIAEISVTEYVEGLYKLELAKAVLGIKKAEAALPIAEDELTEKKTGKEKGAVTIARYELEVAQQTRHVLTEYTRDKRIKELKGATERARADELASKEVYELELSKEKRLERESQACTMVAPRDGKVVYSRGRQQAKNQLQARRLDCALALYRSWRVGTVPPASVQDRARDRDGGGKGQVSQAASHHARLAALVRAG